MRGWAFPYGTRAIQILNLLLLIISSNLNKSVDEKQLYAGKVPSFPKFATINILSFFYLKSNVDIRPPTSAHKYMQIC